MNIQFKKGVLELCVLSLLNKKNRYGYELVNEISKTVDMSEGTIYPLMRRLKLEGYVTTYLEESSEGPSRKYYELTKSGKTILDSLENEWYTFINSVNKILKEGETNE